MELSGEGQLGVRNRVCTRGQWAWNRLPRAMGPGILPKLTEFKHLDSALRYKV